MARGVSPETNLGANLGSLTQRWNKLFVSEVDPGAHVNGAFNKKVTFTSSGTFVAPVTGVYRITLQGGGGGGGGAGTDAHNNHASGGGGASGTNIVFYETLTAGVSYSYTIGAGGTGGAGGSATNSTGSEGTYGGDSQIIINSTTYTASGGGSGQSGTGQTVFRGGFARAGYAGSTIIGYGMPGVGGSLGQNITGGVGGDAGGSASASFAGNFGGGGCGGFITSSGTYSAGSAGGDGYITFEYYDPTQA